MTRTEAFSAAAGCQLNTASPLPPEVIERGKREREFFDRYSNPDQIPDELLRVTPAMESIELPGEVVALMPHLTGKRVCEVGCGYGLYSAYFAQQGAEAFGFDISESNIRVARRTAVVNSVESRMHVDVMQGEATSYPSDYFDMIFGMGVLHHLDVALAAHEMYRLLKPGGVAFFVDPLGENRFLEWARECPLRSTKHHHSPDERALRYQDLDVLHSVFGQLSYREMGLLTVVKALFRKAEAGLIAVPRGQRVLRLFGKIDNWLIAHVPSVRPLASYLLVCLPKPPANGPGGTSDLGTIVESSRSTRRVKSC